MFFGTVSQGFAKTLQDTEIAGIVNGRVVNNIGCGNDVILIAENIEMQ